MSKKFIFTENLSKKFIFYSFDANNIYHLSITKYYCCNMGVACSQLMHSQVCVSLRFWRKSVYIKGNSLLSYEEIEAIRKSWDFLKSCEPDRSYRLLNRTWLLAFQRTPALINIATSGAKVKRDNDIRETLRFQRLVRQVRPFGSSVIL